MQLTDPDLLTLAEDCVRAAFRFWIEHDFRFLNYCFEHQEQSYEWLAVLREDGTAVVGQHYPSDRDIAMFDKNDVLRITRCQRN